MGCHGLPVRPQSEGLDRPRGPPLECACVPYCDALATPPPSSAVVAAAEGAPSDHAAALSSGLRGCTRRFRALGCPACAGCHCLHLQGIATLSGREASSKISNSARRARALSAYQAAQWSPGRATPPAAPVRNRSRRAEVRHRGSGKNTKQDPIRVQPGCLGGGVRREEDGGEVRYRRARTSAGAPPDRDLTDAPTPPRDHVREEAPCRRHPLRSAMARHPTPPASRVRENE